MPAWLTKLVINWFLANLTKDRLDQWAGTAKNFVVPWVRAAGDKVINALEASAKKTKDTSIDDTLVAALRSFWDALLPDTTTTL